ncbi:MAG: SPFH domain-containing protein [Candidatus Helarchaeota archaeon]
MGWFKKKNKNWKETGSVELIVWEKTKTETQRKLIWRVPDKTPGSKYASLEKVASFAVRGSELALFYVKGNLEGVLDGGTYDIEKNARNDATEIVYIDKGIIRVPWGVSLSKGLRTLEGYNVGLNGEIRLQITDAKSFASNVLSRIKEFSNDQLQDWILSVLISAFREITPEYKAYDLTLAKRDEIITGVRVRINNELSLYGLNLVSLDIMGHKFPDDVAETLEYKGEVAKVKAKTELEISKMETEDVLAQKMAELEAKRIQRERALRSIKHEDKLETLTQVKEVKEHEFIKDKFETLSSVELEKLKESSKIELEMMSVHKDAQKMKVMAEAEGTAKMLREKPEIMLKDLKLEIARKDYIDRKKATTLATALLDTIENDYNIKRIANIKAPEAMNALAKIKLAGKEGSKWIEGKGEDEIIKNLDQLTDIVKELGSVVSSESPSRATPINNKVDLERRLKTLHEQLDEARKALLKGNIDKTTYDSLTSEIKEEIDEIKRKL